MFTPPPFFCKIFQNCLQNLVCIMTKPCPFACLLHNLSSCRLTGQVYHPTPQKIKQNKVANKSFFNLSSIPTETTPSFLSIIFDCDTFQQFYCITKPHFLSNELPKIYNKKRRKKLRLLIAKIL